MAFIHGRLFCTSTEIIFLISKINNFLLVDFRVEWKMAVQVSVGHNNPALREESF
jgi:hypothetical protein